MARRDRVCDCDCACVGSCGMKHSPVIGATLQSYFTEESGYVLEADGCSYDTATDLLHAGILEFCGCGNPDGNLRFVLGGLELLDEQRPDGNAWELWFAGHMLREQAHFGSQAVADFFYYWCHRQELTEHGGCIPGWLTAEGKALLALLREWAANPANES